MTQIWSPENPCPECGAASNTGHTSSCSNNGLYDEDGNAIPILDENDFLVLGPELFTEGYVISYKGENYYRACNEFVSDLEDGGQSFCIKRVGHPSTQHEDFDGRTREGEDG